MRLRILILDDDKDTCQLLETALSAKGHEVSSFTDPTKAPLLHNRDCPCTPDDSCADAIIADIVMPNIEGIDFVKILKEAGCWPLTIGNVAIMSGYLTLHYMDDLNDMGVQYFRKPFELDAIYQWADECCERLTTAKGLTNE